MPQFVCKGEPFDVRLYKNVPVKIQVEQANEVARLEEMKEMEELMELKNEIRRCAEMELKKIENVSMKTEDEVIYNHGEELEESEDDMLEGLYGSTDPSGVVVQDEGDSDDSLMMSEIELRDPSELGANASAGSDDTSEIYNNILIIVSDIIDEVALSTGSATVKAEVGDDEINLDTAPSIPVGIDTTALLLPEPSLTYDAFA